MVELTMDRVPRMQYADMLRWADRAVAASAGVQDAALRAAALGARALGRRPRPGLSVRGLMPIVGALAASLVIECQCAARAFATDSPSGVGAKLTFVREQR
jgi:hypothetical protein